MYIKPKTNAHTATMFNENRSYDDMKKWMDKMIRMHGGKAITHDFDEPSFEDDEDGDDELSSVEDTFEDLFQEMDNKSSQNTPSDTTTVE